MAAAAETRHRDAARCRACRSRAQSRDSRHAARAGRCIASPHSARRRPRSCYRQAGDKYLLVEYGPLVLDLNLRFRVHALMQWLQAAADSPGIVDLTPGIRSLQVHFDSRVLPLRATCWNCCSTRRSELPPIDDMEVPTRIVHLPLSWDDPATRLAIEKYMQSVRTDAPWCPSNIEFIRRINGLDSIDDVQRIVFDASYLVLGLGDVYLGAPVATPLDPRHRLVTTKYNPARTWTPENAVGIGGAYLCVYGMEGPGGYQFVGRTVQMWNRYRADGRFHRGQAVAAALLRPDPLLSGQRAGAAAGSARTSRSAASAADRGNDVLAARLQPLPGEQRRVDRRLQVETAGGLRSRTGALESGRPGGLRRRCRGR